MTEFIPVVVVVDFYWPDTVNECLREGHLLNSSFMKQSFSWAGFEKLTRFLFVYEPKQFKDLGMTLVRSGNLW